jgi:NAD(P)-dependent dehydrogenase (short-subunit alcohol dehydrogenase family)
MKLKDKVVYITDGACLTGLTITERFKNEGAILAMNIFPKGSGEKQGIVTHANPVLKNEVDAAIALVLDKYGRIDIAVLCNNDVILSNLEDCTDDAYDQALDLNLKSAFLFIQAIGPSMKQIKKGNFIFISSIHGEKPNGAAFSYSITQGAIKMLTREMALDLGPFNIRTNIVALGPMEGHDKLFYSDFSPLYEHTKERIVNEKYVTPGDAANAALFFASDDCPSANGSELTLDGGFLLTYYLRRRRPTQ